MDSCARNHFPTNIDSMNRSDDYRPTAVVCPFGDHEGRGLCDMAIQQEIELYKPLQIADATGEINLEIVCATATTFRGNPDSCAQPA